MPSATRLNDNCTGHDSCGPRPLITGSGDVFINGRSAGRQTDRYAAHGCIVHSSHSDVITGGAPSVFVNGLPLARVGDAVSLGGSVAEGSPDVFAGDGEG